MHQNPKSQLAMKKMYFFAGCLLATSVWAQTKDHRVVHQRTSEEPTRSIPTGGMLQSPATETVIWSENFASGIPATWDNTGGTANGVADPDVKWEYRGPSTTPAVTTGSRGGYVGTRGPIQSATAANGFVIFDSDFLDNAGIAGNFGNGIGAAPHLANLTTPSINLTGYTEVDIQFTQYYRRFAGPTGQGVPATYLDFSTNGGTTWPYSVTLNAGIAVNSATPTADQVAVPLPAGVANQSNVKIRFRFEGDYYFWMIDDIQLIETPKHRIEFVALPSGAPKVDIVYGPASGSAKMGHMNLKQVRPITFDANVINTGSESQSNVKLQMRIFNAANNQLVQTLNSATTATLATGDTLDYNALNTYSSAWTPTAEGTYKVVHAVLSDSTTAVFADTGRVVVSSDLLSIDFGRWANSIGTPNVGNDGSAFASRMDLVDDERLYGVTVGLANLVSASGSTANATFAGGTVEFSLFDSSAFDGFTTGFDQNAILAYGQKTISAADSAAGTIYFDLTDPTTGYPMLLTGDSYYMVFTMYSNNGADPIRIKNDATFENASGSALMYLTTVNGTAYNRWFTGYSSSRSFENPWIRATVCPSATAAACMGIGLTEEHLKSITVAPNPANDWVRLNFGSAEGIVDVEFVDCYGRVLLQREVAVQAETTVPFATHDWAPGIYFARIRSGQAQTVLPFIVD